MRSERIVGMALCYPGVDRHGGDLPPVPDCAPLWHPRVLPLLPDLRLTLLVGSYAHRRYLATMGGGRMTDVVARWRDYLPRYLPLPHPSWRNTGWLKRNPWFEAEILPVLRERVAAALTPPPRAVPCPRR